MGRPFDVNKEQSRRQGNGDGPARTLLLARAQQLNLGGKVRFRGWVERDRIWPEVDVLLLPSLHEGMSNAVLEALASSIPVLASDVPEHREVLPSGCLVDPRDIDGCDALSRHSDSSD